MRPNIRIISAIFLSVGCETALAESSEGISFRLSLYPDISRVNSEETETESSTSNQNASPPPSNVSSDEDQNQTHLSLGGGYAMSSGFYMGANLFQQTYSYTSKSTSSAGSAERTYTYKGKATMTAFGPTVGYMHNGGFNAFFTPFLTVATTSKTTSESDYVSTTSRPEPDVKDDSKTSGYRIDLSYHFRINQFSVGPELNYTALKTKIDVTTTEQDPNYTGQAASSTTTRETGTTETARVLPMIGMAVFL